MIKQGEQEKQVVLWGYLTRESLSTQRLFNVASVAIVAISNSQLVIDIGIGNIFTLATFSKFHSTTTTTTMAAISIKTLGALARRGVICYNMRQWKRRMGAIHCALGLS